MKFVELGELNCLFTYQIIANDAWNVMKDYFSYFEFTIKVYSLNLICFSIKQKLNRLYLIPRIIHIINKINIYKY